MVEKMTEHTRYLAEHVTELQDSFWEKGRMRPRTMGSQFGVRHCTHIFNSEAEIDKALEIVRGLAKR